MYNSATIDMVIAAHPRPVSLACLSCHGAPATIDPVTGALSGMWLLAGPAALGVDLRDDHPISFRYDPTRDPGLKPVAAAAAAGLVFYGSAGDQVECPTCHDPHGRADTPRLRLSNRGGALCLACHDT